MFCVKTFFIRKLSVLNVFWKSRFFIAKICLSFLYLPSLNRRFRIAKTYVSLLENVGFSMEKRIKLFGAMHYSQKVFIKEKRKRT